MSGLGVSGRARIKLKASRTFWVRGAGGSDSNDGSTGTLGFATLQRAIDVIWNTIDTNGFPVNIQLIGGVTYAMNAVINGPVTGGGQVTINGSAASPGTILLSATNADCILAQNAAKIVLVGFKVTTTGTKGNGLRSTSGAQIIFGSMEFGAVVNSHLDADYGGTILTSNNYTISGGGQSHLHSETMGTIDISNRTVTLTGTPAFSAYFAGTSFGFVQALSTTFSGTATGYKFICHYLGGIRTDTNNLDLLPGSLPGTVAQGGVYDNYGETIRFRPYAALTANGTFTVPASYKLQDIVFRNTTGNAVTINVGTSAGGSDVVNALAIGANGWISAFDQAALLKRLLNATAATTLYVSSANWNGATLLTSVLQDSLVPLS